MQVKVNMLFSKETPGTYVYAEADEDGNPIQNKRETKIPTLYIRKEAFGADVPETVTLTVDW